MGGTKIILVCKIKMVSIVIGAALNAGLFIGGSYLAKALDDDGSAEDLAEERERRAKAIEHTREAQAEYAREHQERLDFINNRLRQENEARRYINDMDEAMKRYYLVTKEHLDPLPPRPELSGFYQPSEAQKTGELLFISGGLGLAGFLVYRYM